MKYYEAVQTLLEKGLRVGRAGWKGYSYVLVVDPLKYPQVTGDDVEFVVFSQPNNVKTPIRCGGPFDTKIEAEEWLAKKTADVQKMWERYERYLDLKKVRADQPLDFAVAPDFSMDVLKVAAIEKIPKMSSKRLGVKFLAVMGPGKTLEPYTPSNTDIFADDWRVA